MSARAPGPGILRRALGRVQRALADAPSRIARRAALTLDLAVGSAGDAQVATPCTECRALVGAGMASELGGLGVCPRSRVR